MNRTTHRPFRRHRLACAVAAAAASMGFSSGAGAQEAARGEAPRAARSAQLEEVLVTGSRIRQTDGMATPTPVTTITSAELTSFDPGGTVAEQLDVLPQFFGNLSTQSSTGALNFGSALGVSCFIRRTSDRPPAGSQAAAKAGQTPQGVRQTMLAS